MTTLEQSVTIFCTALQLQSVKSEASLSFWQAMKDALTVQELTDQPSQLHMTKQELRQFLQRSTHKSTSSSWTLFWHTTLQVLRTPR